MTDLAYDSVAAARLRAYQRGGPLLLVFDALHEAEQGVDSTVPELMHLTTMSRGVIDAALADLTDLGLVWRSTQDRAGVVNRNGRVQLKCPGTGHPPWIYEHRGCSCPRCGAEGICVGDLCELCGEAEAERLVRFPEGDDEYALCWRCAEDVPVGTTNDDTTGGDDR